MEERRLRSPRLNNMTLSYARRSVEYDAVMADLVLIGAIPKEVYEQLTGTRFSDQLKLPDGYAVKAEENGKSG
jgi:hypothetical protein